MLERGVENGLGRRFGLAPAIASTDWMAVRGCYEQITGGCPREVRLNVTLPAEESNLALVGLVRTSVPSWNGLPHPGGGFLLPSDTGGFARQKVPSILAQKMPQCV